jgi:acyl-CoA synthetase (AMP-forming)/AMP-acid ligase II
VPHRYVILSHDDVAPASLPEAWDWLDDAIAPMPSTPVAGEREGAPLWFSSGTSGRPKGVVRDVPDVAAGNPDEQSLAYAAKYGFGPATVHLALGPLHHAAPIGFSTMVQRFGGTVVLTERFDAEAVLGDIERYRVTFSHIVPTMFVRFLKLPDDVRARYDVSSLQHVLHGAAPCPADVKRRMIEWWGPILHEYYAGTEGNGFCYIDSLDWLEHPGSVGRSLIGTIHICDESGAELPVGEAGTIYFERDAVPFEYHGDPAKTRDSRHPDHPNWSTLGDMGRVDDEGYLYLTDRKAFMIISGGVNIYPQEIEDCLLLHPKVVDVAVFGIPNRDMGEEVKAVVQPAADVTTDDALAAELLAYAREHIAHYKVPRSIDFEAELPRLPTGKLYKRLLRDRYWGDKDSRIV